VNGAEEFFRKVMAADTRELKAWTDVMSRLPAQPDPISGRRLMGIGRLRSLAAHPLVTVASHSMSHQSLATLPEPWCRWELETSVRHIREWGGDPEAFGYPYGDAMAFSGTTEKLLAANGVRCAFTTLAFRVSKDSRPLALGRATLYDSAGFHYMRGTAGGAFERWENARAKK
jgi:peptidoglycan/xylan/chitin deacetylase (PgdA/CDA1 family)